MKKLLSLLLLVALLCSVASCGKPEQPADTSSAESSEEESSVEPFVEDEKIAKIRACFGEAPDRSLKAKNLFRGLKYTYSLAPSDSEYLLTNGETHVAYDRTAFVHFEGSSTTLVTFDLGEGEHKLADICVDCLQKTSYSIRLPSRVRIYVSDDGENYLEIASQLAPSDAGESCKYVFAFAFPGVISARYIRIGIGHSGQADIDEIVAYEYCEDGDIDVANGELVAFEKDPDFYGYKLNTEVTTPVSSGDSDYKKTQNLALLPGASITAQSFDPLTKQYADLNAPKEDLAKLIDGQKAQNAHYRDPAMVTFFRGAGRHVIVDLGNEMAVSGAKGEFLQYTSAGIRVPEFINVSLSTDGKEWITVDDGKTNEYMKDGSELYALDCKFGKSYLARYVRFSFITQYNYESTVEVDCTELEVWGTKDASSAVPASTPEGLIGGSYPDPEKIGVHNLLWSCSGYVKDGYGFTYDNSLAYFAYLDDNGEIKDRFFDSVVIGGMAKLRTPEDCKPAVEDFVKEFNTKDTNLDAINQISGTLLEKFGDGKKITVWINLVCPNSTFYCSDIDGDGKSEDFKDVNDCLKFLKWQVDLHVAAFKEAGYQNIELAGFYWNNESIYKSDYALQCETIKKHNAYLHSIGLRSIWCPYYGAYGQWAWKDVDFDFAMLQPNYMFSPVDAYRLKTTADMAKILGMGIELEIEDYTGSGSINRYHEYLRAGYDFGYINAANALYQGAIPGALVKSREKGGDSPSVYHDTYLFATGKLDDSYNLPVAKDVSHFTDAEASVEAGEVTTLNIGALNGCKLRTLLSPAFGIMRLDFNGTIRFLAPDYVGDITAEYEAFDELGNRKTIHVLIHVTEPKSN
ncbi:MAG: DUF4855 domain-containing protein [Clostridiales bacterium]|nr:DUF4855 domain-containing protein [Candidatus Coliplasma caballi]